MHEPHPRRRILVIDDDPSLIETLTESLRELGDFDVCTARDGVSGLAQFFEVRPDCVVVDIRMPGLNGYQLMRALRGDPASASTPIVVLSAQGGDHDQLAGLLSGADAYLLKPLKLADLLHTIEDVIKLSAAEHVEQAPFLSGNDAPAKER